VIIINNIISKVALKFIMFIYLLSSLGFVLLDVTLSLYIFPVNCFLIIVICSLGKWVDIRIGLLFFTSIYYVGQYLNFFILNSDDISSGLSDRIIIFNLNDYYTNIEALSHVVVFQVGVLVQFISQEFSFNEKYYLYRYKNIIDSKYVDLIKFGKWPIIFLLILFTLQLDWELIKYKYTLGGMSEVFFLCYLLFTISTMDFIYRIYSGRLINYLHVFWLMFFLIIFNYLGVRQVLFWSACILFFGFSSFYSIKNCNTLGFLDNKKSFFIVILCALSFLMVLNIGFLFRHQKMEMLNVLANLSFSQIFSSTLSGFFAETKLTTYNLLAVINENNNGNTLRFLESFRDFFVMLIPSGLWREKYQYLEVINFSKEHNVTPFGTWYIVGFFSSLVVHPFYLFITSYIYSFFIYAVSVKIFSQHRPLVFASTLYGVAYSFLGLYVVRGTLFGGVKIALSIMCSLFILNVGIRILKNGSKYI